MSKKAIMNHFNHFFDISVNKGKLPFSESLQKPQFNRFVTGVRHPILNGIFQKGSLSEDVIQEQLDYYKEKNTAFCWWLHDEVNHKEMSLKLTEKGFKPIGVMHGVAGLMKDLNELPKIPSHIVVKQVKTNQEIIDWVNILLLSFNCTANEGHFYTNVLLNTLNQPDTFFYLGYLNGKPVGCAALIMTEDSDGTRVGGLWCGGVLSEARKHGVGTAMARYRHDHAKKLKADLMACYLMPDGMARGYCDKLGLTVHWEMFPHFSP